MNTQQSWAAVADDLRPTLRGRVSIDDDERRRHHSNFGRIYQRTAALVIEAHQPDDVVKVLKYANDHDLHVATRGQAHSQSTQNIIDDGLLLVLSAMNTIDEIQPDDTVWVDAGATWRSVVERCVEFGLAPPVLTNNIDVTVGGTISIAGIGVASFRHGTQADHCVELEVATPAVGLVSCSSENNRELFDAVRCGLGEFGIITRARLRLHKIQSSVRIFHLLYDDLGALLRDQALLMDNPAVASIQSFCSPAVQGLRKGDADWETFAVWFYPLQVGVEWTGSPPEAASILSDLRPYRADVALTDLSYAEFTRRMDPMFDLWKATGYWDLAHPWIEVVLPWSAAPVIEAVLSRLPPAALGGGHVILWPAKKASSTVPLFSTPDEELLLGFGVLGGVMPQYLSDALPKLQALHEMLIGVGGKRYLSGYVEMNAEGWAAHFGDQWSVFCRAKAQYDPKGILHTGFVVYE